MFKKFIYIIFGAVLLAGCSTENGPQAPVPDLYGDEVEIKVAPALNASAFMNGTDIEPMTKASSGLNRVGLRSTYHIFLYKRVGDDYFVDQLLEVPIEGSTSLYGITFYTPEELNFNFSFMLRPGDYKMTVIMNAMGGALNLNLKPGAKVWNVNEPESTAPYMVRYAAAIDYVDRLSLQAEVYVGTSEFTVEKNQHLTGQSPTQHIPVEMRNMTGKVRIMGKKTGNSRENSFVVDRDNHYATSYTLRSTDPTKKFCDGINAFGQPYYENNYESLKLAMGVSSKSPRDDIYEVSDYNSEKYLMSLFGLRNAGMFYFADPDDTEGIQGVITEVNLNLSSSYYSDYMWGNYPGSFYSEPAVFKAKAMHALSLEFSGDSYTVNNPVFNYYFLQKSTDEYGNEEDAALLFDAYAEMN